ncbi:hypothetical protein HYT00_01680 [Candidatus Giovannonibacteria bacterium]|nr:hypothetical protein [Candidatus Giovannonibacteria bacterium]
MKVAGVIGAIVIAIIVILAIVPVFLKPGGGETKVGAATLFKSDDGGLTWKPIDKFQGGEILNINFDSGDRKNLLIGTRRRGMWRGNVSGDEFSQYPGGVGEASQIFDLVTPATGGEFVSLVLFNNRGRVIRYRDGNRTELMFTPLELFAFLKGYKTRQGHLRIIGSDGGFYESQNNGETWRVKSRFQKGLTSMTFNPVHDNQVWVLDPQGSLYSSEDGGETWKDLTQSLRDFPGSQTSSLIFLDPKTQLLYHTSKHGLLRSVDGGESWEQLKLIAPKETLPVTSLAIDESDPSQLYVAAQNQIYISRDGGETWKNVQASAGGIISVMLVNPSNSKEIFMGIRNI